MLTLEGDFGKSEFMASLKIAIFRDSLHFHFSRIPFTIGTHMKTDYLARLRNGEQLSLKQQLLLIFQLSLPAILAQLSSIVMSYIDASMAGRLGAADSASIGLVASSTWLIAGFCFSLSMGYTVQTAHLLGAKRDGEARNLLKNSILVNLVYSLLITVIFSLVSGRVPIWLGATEEIYENARIYFLIFALSVPIIQFHNLAAGMLQSSGEMKISSVLQILMAILNVGFNYLFIFVLNLGVLGAAVGTLISRAIITLLLMIFLFTRSPSLRLKKGEKFVFKVEYTKKAVKIGLPVAFEQLIMSGGQVAFTKIVAPLGKIPLAANSFAITAESLCYMPAYGLGAAATTLAGQSYGAKRYDLTYRLGHLTTGIGIVLMFLAGGLMFIFAPEMIGFLSPDAEIKRLGAKVLRIEAFSEPFYGSSLVANGALRGTGDTLIPSIYKFVTMWLIRIPLAIFLRTRYGLEGIWFAMSFELCVRGILFLIRLAGKGWVK